MITVKELKEIINDLSDETPIVMSSDGEGNNYSPLAGYCTGVYVPESTWAGQFYDSAEFESECKEGYCDAGSAITALCIWPTN